MSIPSKLAITREQLEAVREKTLQTVRADILVQLTNPYNCAPAKIDGERLDEACIHAWQQGAYSWEALVENVVKRLDDVYWHPARSRYYP